MWAEDEIDEIDNLIKEEREQLKVITPIELIDYIQTSVEILMDVKAEDYMKHRRMVKLQHKKNVERAFWQMKEGSQSPRSTPWLSDSQSVRMITTDRTQLEYEQMLQKLENDVW